MQNNDVHLSGADIVVGLNQSLKLIRRGEAVKIYLASDADSRFSEKVAEESGQVPLDISKTSEELAEIAKIDVPCAIITVKKS